MQESINITRKNHIKFRLAFYNLNRRWRKILRNKLNLYSKIAMYVVDKGKGKILHIKIK